MEGTRLLRCGSVVALVAAVPMLTGCGLMFGGTHQMIQAQTTPAGAKVKTEPETTELTTPATLSLERKNNYTLVFSHVGYQPSRLVLQKQMRGGIVVLDILCGLVGVIVDAATGAWYKLEPEMATVTLVKGSASLPGPDKITVTVSVRNHKDGPTNVEMKSDEPVEVSVEPRS